MSSLEAGPVVMVAWVLSLTSHLSISQSGHKHPPSLSTLGNTLQARQSRLEYYLQNINISFHCLANHLPVT